MAVMDYSLVQRIIDGTGQILDTTPGSPDSGSYVTEAQLRDWIKAGILFSGYYYNGNFYSDSGHTSPLAKVEGALYVDKTNSNKALYVCLSSTYQSLTEEAQVQAIIDGLNDGTIVPLKAKQDQNGNVIDTTYETKADANDLKNALSATNKRVTNLEQKAGDELTITYPHVTYGMDEVPANVAEYGKVVKLRGVTRGVNQLCNKATYINGSSGEVTSTNNGDGTFTITVSATTSTDRYVGLITNNVTSYVKVPVGHRFLIHNCGYSAPTGVQYVNGYNGYSLGLNNLNAQASSSDGYILLTVLVPQGVTAQTFTLKPHIVDLNQYFSSDPSVDVSTLTISDIQSKYPELLIPSDYDTGTIVSTTYSAVKSVGVNIFDEVTEIGYINESNGQNISGNTTLRSKNYIPVKPSTAYYLPPTPRVYTIYWYDVNKNFISRVYRGSTVDTSFTSPSNASYLRFCTYDTYGTTYLHDIQICLNSASDKTTYHPYMTDTLSLPSPVTLRSAGSVHDELDVESGEDAVITILADFGDFTWSKSSSITNGFVAIGGLPSAMKGAVDDSSVINAICSKGYECKSYASLVYGTSPDMAMSFRATPNLGIVIVDSTFSSYYSSFDADTFKTAVTGIKIVVERASADIIQKTPVLDPFLKVEGGGTIRPIQTQTTEIDSAMTAEYLSLGANA